MSTSRADAVPSPPGAPVLRRHYMFDSWVDDYTVSTLLEDIEAAATSRRKWLIANHNVNSLALVQKNPAFRAFFDRADRIFVDGTGALFLARLTRAGWPHEHRVAVLDWIWPLCALAEERGWRIVHVGGTGAGLARARDQIRARHPHLDLTVIDGFFDVRRAEEVDAVLAQIAQARPTVLLVGMGMPRQELWLDDIFDRIPDAVVITVGGILSFIGGERPTPPRWLGRFGVEWLYRLATEPRRLWRRYLVEPLRLLPAAGQEIRRVRGRDAARP